MTEETAAPAEAPVAEAPVTSDWRASLPDDLRAAPSLQDVNDVATLAKRFIDTKSMVGNSLRMPTDDAGQEAIDAFTNKILENQTLGLMKKPNQENLDEVYAQLGRPEEPSGYEAPEGADPETFGALATKAHELGLSKGQYEQLAAYHASLTNDYMEHQSRERAVAVDQLRGEWGPAYDEKVSRVGNVIKALGGHEQLENALANGEIDAGTLRLFDKIATQLGSENSQIAQQIGSVQAETVDELKQRRDEITQRLLQDDLTSQQRDDLQRKLIGYSEKIVASAR